MRRLTQKDDNGWYLTGDGIYSDWGVPEKFRGEDIDRLAVIEDILGDEYDLERLKFIMDADSAVPVVRCWECRYRLPKGTVCQLSGMDITEDDFCSRGQRKIETALPKSDAKNESLEVKP